MSNSIRNNLPYSTPSTVATQNASGNTLTNKQTVSSQFATLPQSPGSNMFGSGQGGGLQLPPAVTQLLERAMVQAFSQLLEKELGGSSHGGGAASKMGQTQPLSGTQSPTQTPSPAQAQTPSPGAQTPSPGAQTPSPAAGPAGPTPSPTPTPTNPTASTPGPQDPDVGKTDAVKKGPDGQLPVFGPSGKPEMKDVNQGMEPDCHVLAGLQAAVQHDPKAIEDGIKPAGPPGVYNVTLFDHGKPKTVQVNNDAGDFNNSEENNIAGQKDTKPTWARLYEKAIKQNGGNFGTTDFEAITGKPATYATLDTPSKQNNALISSSLANVQVRSSPDSGLMDNHSYTVTGHNMVDASGKPTTDPNAVDQSKSTVTLRNPWGHNDIPEQKSGPTAVQHLDKNSAYITMPVADFYKNFDPTFMQTV